MRKAQDYIVSGGLIALGVYLWAKDTGALDDLPLIGPFFWPTTVPESLKQWYSVVDEHIPQDGFKVLVLATIWQESNGVHFKADGSVIMGAAGEIGLCQIMPATGQELGFTPEELRDPVKNILACHAYLSQGFEKWNAFYESRPELGSTALHDICRYYNGGPNVINQYDAYSSVSVGYANQVIHKYEILTPYLHEIDIF